jgi:serine/threonine-protein kinase
MAVCHECDSNVAENDIFCPFCGISLQPVASARDEVVADDLESTIMMTPAEAAELAASAKAGDSSVPPNPVELVPETIEPIEIDEPKDLESIFAVLNEPADQTPVVPVEIPEPQRPGSDLEGIVDVPTHQILSDLTDTSGNIPYRSTAEYAKDETGEIVESSTPPVAEPGEEYPVHFVEANEEPTLDEFPAVESGDGSASKEVSAGIPDESAPGEMVSTETGGEEARVDSIQPTEAPSPDEPGTDLPEDRMIGMPGDSKALEDPYPSKSMFDSVRIMEGRPPFSEDDVATRVPNFGSAPLSDQAVESVVPTPVEEKPQTASSTGFNDTDGRKSSKLKPLTEGTILNNRYEIIRKIGGGGMGAVYLASDNNLGGVLRAVKEMVQAHIEEDQQDKAINDFKRESMILSSLDHPSIPTIFDYFYDEEESRFYLVMKYISGGDLASRLRAAPEGRIDEKAVTEWGVQVTEVLEYLHNQPTTIVYRDLKPSNIMIDGNSGRVMLVDFGIARSISQKEEKGVTAVGTMGYAPPELFSGNVEPRSDIYSLGSTMFHLMTGADPQSNPLLIFDFQKNPRPRQINPRLSDQMERILMKAVEYSADLRFRDAAELRSALNSHSDDIRSGNLTYGAGQAPVSVSLSNQQVFCGFCGQRIVATDLFCAFCGAKQPIAQQGVHSEIYGAASPSTAKLLIEGTSELTAPAFTLQKDENLVGRRDPMSNIFPEVDLSKYDPQTKISRRHARIWRDGQTFLLEDLGSSNGTVLTSSIKDSFRLIPHKPQALGNGDKIKIGDTVLHFIVN